MGARRDAQSQRHRPSTRTAALWVAEETMYPKRFSVWAADGKLVTDFIGPHHLRRHGRLRPIRTTRTAGSSATAASSSLDYAANKGHGDGETCLMTTSSASF